VRYLIGSGMPRGLQNRPATIAPLLLLLGATRRWLVAIRMAPTHGGSALVSVTDYDWPLFSGDHLHHRLLRDYTVTDVQALIRKEAKAISTLT
jgi:hypothetical protein